MANNGEAIIVISDSESEDEDEAQGPVRGYQHISLSNSPSPRPAGANGPGDMFNRFDHGPVAGYPDAAMAEQPEAWNDYDDIFDDVDFYDDEPGVVEQQNVMEEANPRSAARILFNENANQQVNVEPPGIALVKDQCIDAIVELFPDICRNYVSDLYDTLSIDQEYLVIHILDKASYPKAKDAQRNLKRKRVLDEDEEAAKKYTAPNRDVGPKVFM